MSTNKITTLDRAIEAARGLPAETQEAVAAELMEVVEDLSTPDRPNDRQELIKKRLAKPLKAVSRDHLTAILRRYNPTI